MSASNIQPMADPYGGLLDAEPSDPDPAERWNPLEDRCDDPSCLICNPLVANSGKPLDGSVDLGEVPER